MSMPVDLQQACVLLERERSTGYRKYHYRLSRPFPLIFIRIHQETAEQDRGSTKTSKKITNKIGLSHEPFPVTAISPLFLPVIIIIKRAKKRTGKK